VQFNGSGSANLCGHALTILPVFLMIPMQHIYPSEYEGHFDSLMISSQDIKSRVQQLAALIRREYDGTRPVLICMLKGACPFFIHLTDALQELRQGYDTEFVRVTSYDGTSTTGNVQVVGELKVESLRNRNVVLIEDIVDTGTTLSSLIPLLKEQGSPASVKVCTLLDKRLEDSALDKLQADFIGFSIPNKFIIGYGLDYNEFYRDLKDIFVISQAGIDYGGGRSSICK
jgi:hypoxanthine phosphoribosyltransferase